MGQSNNRNEAAGHRVEMARIGGSTLEKSDRQKGQPPDGYALIRYGVLHRNRPEAEVRIDEPPIEIRRGLAGLSGRQEGRCSRGQQNELRSRALSRRLFAVNAKVPVSAGRRRRRCSSGYMLGSPIRCAASLVASPWPCSPHAAHARRRGRLTCGGPWGRHPNADQGSDFPEPMISRHSGGARENLRRFHSAAGVGLASEIGTAFSHIRSNDARNPSTNRGARVTTRSLSCCFRPLAVRFADPDRNSRPSTA